MNWRHKTQVVKYAEKLGPGLTVYKHPDRANYSIAHTSRTEGINPDWVVCQT